MKIGPRVFKKNLLLLVLLVLVFSMVFASTASAKTKKG